MCAMDDGQDDQTGSILDAEFKQLKAQVLREKKAKGGSIRRRGRRSRS